MRGTLPAMMASLGANNGPRVVRGPPLLRTYRTRWMSGEIAPCADARVWRVMRGFVDSKYARNEEGGGVWRRGIRRRLRAMWLASTRYMWSNKHLPLAPHSFDIVSSATKARTSSVYVRASSVCRSGS